MPVSLHKTPSCRWMKPLPESQNNRIFLTKRTLQKTGYKKYKK